MFRKLIAFLSLFISVASAQETQPLIDPGYTPLSSETEIGLWTEVEDYERAVKTSALRLTDPAITEYVEKAMCRVAADYCKDLRTYVIRNPGFNASMTANGMVQVWSGLLLRVTSEAELAAVLGHELAHYTQLHSLSKLKMASSSMAAGVFIDIGIAILTGISTSTAQLIALSSTMAYSRDQETESDILGLKFMTDAGYDPYAAARVWEMIVIEEESAKVKRASPSAFTQSHPTEERRISDLKNATKAYESLNPGDFYLGKERHLAFLNENYFLLMEDQIDTNRFGRTEALLDRHREMGIHDTYIDFFRAEMLRQRGEPKDLDLTISLYEAAANGSPPVNDALYQLGYLYIKKNENQMARERFEQYLALTPNTDDRAMIQFYLDTLQ